MSLITKAEVKAVGRIGYDTQDTVIDALILSAISFVEQFCEFKLSSEDVVDERVDSDGGQDLWIAVHPVTSVTSVKDSWDSDELTDSDTYYANPTRITKTELSIWGSGPGRYLITYTGGYTDATAPVGLKPALIGLTLLAFNNGEGRSSQSDLGQTVNWQALTDGNNIISELRKFSFYQNVE